MYLSAWLNGFSDELTKIAGAGLSGAMIGGGLGALATKGLKGGLIGAAAGGLIGGTVGAGKKLLTQQSERQKMMASQPTWEPQGYVPTWQRHLAG